MAGRSRDDENERESRAILERVRQETEPQIGAGTGRMLFRVWEHFSAADADPADRIEVLGTRIGRSLGLVAFLVLAVWLIESLIGV